VATIRFVDARVEEELAPMPGSEIVVAGLEDLEASRDTANASAVLMASARLRAAGIDVPDATTSRPPAHLLYEHLATAEPRGAHSRYNAIQRRVISFARAVERARAG
jgi:hypothetical protein